MNINGTEKVNALVGDSAIHNFISSLVVKASILSSILVQLMCVSIGNGAYVVKSKVVHLPMSFEEYSYTTSVYF